MLNANPATEDMIRDMAREARNGIRRIFLHWTGGHYGHNEDAYHICIDWDGTVYVNCKSFLSFKAHTLNHNTGAIGIALLCGCDAHCWAPAGKDASLLDVAYENDHMAGRTAPSSITAKNRPHGSRLKPWPKSWRCCATNCVCPLRKTR